MKKSLIFLFFLALIPFHGNAQVRSISLFNFAWHIQIQPNGSARAQFGSLPEDNLVVKPGQIDFKTLLETLDTAQRKTPPGNSEYQIGIHYDGQTEIRSFSLVDEAFLIQMLRSIDKKWKPTLGGSRIMKIKKEHPIVKKAKDAERKD